MLLAWVKKNGPTKWTECSKLIKGRCGKQCRERWVNILNPVVKKGNWSDEEQQAIFQALVEFHTSWSSMAKILKGRTENSIKNYFYSSVRRIKQSPVFQLMKEVYLLKTKQPVSWEQFHEEYQVEFQKFNLLSQMILRAIFGQEESVGFQCFLLGLVFEKPQSYFEQRHLATPLTESYQNKMGSEIYVPKETKRSPLNIQLNTYKTPQAMSSPGVFSILKQCANQSNQPDLLHLIDFLKNKLSGEEIQSVQDNNKTQIQIPFCWNCKLNKCQTHHKE